MRFLSSNKELIVDILLSLALAFFIWIGVSLTKKVPKEIVLNVPVQLINIPPNVEIINFTPSVNIKLSGPTSIINSITPQEVQVVVDIAGIKGDGEHVIRISKRNIIVPVEELLKEPVTKTITVNLVELEEKRVKVIANVYLYPAPGYKVEKKLEYPVVTVKGPKKLVEKVGRLITEKFIKSNIKESFIKELGFRNLPKGVKVLEGDSVKLFVTAIKVEDKKKR